MSKLPWYLSIADELLAAGMLPQALEAFKNALGEANRLKRRRCAGYIIVAIRCTHQAMRA